MCTRHSRADHYVTAREFIDAFSRSWELGALVHARLMRPGASSLPSMDALDLRDATTDPYWTGLSGLHLKMESARRGDNVRWFWGKSEGHPRGMCDACGLCTDPCIILCYPVFYCQDRVQSTNRTLYVLCAPQLE